MKYLYLFTLCLFTSHCFSQTLVEYNDSHGRTKLLGPIPRERLAAAPFDEWYNAEYATYNAEDAVVQQLGEKLAKIDSIAIFLGTWCGDSRREVPRFLKILDSAAFTSYRLIGLESTIQNYKQSPFHEEEGLNIHRVPTFIFYSDSTEVGRIVEFPVESLEKDMDAILKGSYRPNYRIVAELDKLLAKHGYRFALERLDSLEKVYKPLINRSSELSTYGLKLFTSFEIPWSHVAYELNCRLFPDNYMSFYALGRFYASIGDSERAKTAFLKSLALEPGNESVVSQLALLK